MEKHIIVRLNNGMHVLGRMTKYGETAYAFANLRQAVEHLCKTRDIPGEAMSIYRHNTRPIYIAVEPLDL